MATPMRCSPSSPRAPSCTRRSTAPCRPREFYPTLFADTSSASVTLLGTMRGTSVEGRALLSFLFHFDWVLPGGTPAPFDVVDVAELDDDGLITSIRIIYDTVDVRPAFEADTGKTSGRPSIG